MAARAPTLAFDYRYVAPPEFVTAWMTDYRPDDDTKWFEARQEGKVTRTPTGFLLEREIPRMGHVRIDVRLDRPNHVSAESRIFTKRGRLNFVNQIEETVRPEGSGSLLQIRIWSVPQRFAARLLLLFGKPIFRRQMKDGFDRMGGALESDYSKAARATISSTNLPVQVGREDGLLRPGPGR